MLKFIFILNIALLSSSCFAQISYVRVDHEVYPFLNRMSALNIISNYDEFELPKTRKTVTSWIIEIIKNSSKLNSADKSKLQEFVREFNYDINKSNDDIDSFIPKYSLSHFVSDKEKYTYSYTEPSKFELFLNIVPKIEQIYLTENSKSYKATLLRLGGKLEASFYNKVGISLFAENGKYYGDRQIKYKYKDLRYNFKLNLDPNYYDATDYFDKSEGYLTADFDFIKLKIGNDRNLIGYGDSKMILGYNPPTMDYISLNLNYNFFNYSFYYGKIGGKLFSGEDSTGSVRKIDDKYFVYHRLMLDISKHIKIGLGEFLIYGNRNIDFAYLNPVNFYKSAEHKNMDRDNSYMFLSLENRSINGLKINFSFLIDDMNFNTLGTGNISNKFLYNFNILSSNLYHILPIDLSFQYIRIDPYFYSHRKEENNFTSSGFIMNSNIQPNSQLFKVGLHYYPTSKLFFDIAYKYIEHGENEYDNENNLIKNFGGNIKYGFRTTDNIHIKFLDGVFVTTNQVDFSIKYEFINNYWFGYNLEYILDKSKYRRDNSLLQVINLRLNI